MNRTRTFVIVAAGAFATLGIAGTALASAGGGPARSVLTVAAPSASPSDDSLLDDSLPDGSSSDGSLSGGTASPSDDSSPRASASAPRGAASPGGSASPSTGGAAPAGSGIDEATARAIAVRAAGGGHVQDVERETEHGRAVWDVDVIAGGVEHDIDVDAATGQVTRHETDDERDDHGDDQRDDHGDDERDDHGDDDGAGHHDGAGHDRGDDRGGDRDDD